MPMFTGALFTVAKGENKPISLNRWMDKRNMVWTYKRILLSQKKNEVLIHATIWRTLESIMLSKIRQIQNDKYCMIPHTDYLE